MDRHEIQEMKRKLEQLQLTGTFGTANKQELREEESDQDSSKSKYKGSRQEQGSEGRQTYAKEGAKEKEQIDAQVDQEIVHNRELIVRNEVCLLRERLNDIEVREVEMNQKLQELQRKMKLQQLVKKGKEGGQDGKLEKWQLKFNQQLHRMKDSVDQKMKEFQNKIVVVADSKGELTSLEGDGFGRLLKIINAKAGADDVRQFILSNEFKLQKMDDRLRYLGFQLQKNSKITQNIVGVIKGVGGGGQFNNILLSTKGIHCLSCGRNEYGKVILNKAPQGYTHGSPFKSARRSYNQTRGGVQISPHVPRGYNISDGEGSVNQSARSKSPDFLNRSNKLLVGSAKLSLEEYMNKTADMFNKRDHHYPHHSQPSDVFGASVRSSYESPQMQGKHDPRVQTEHSQMNQYMRKEMHSKSPFVEERERYYYYQSPEVRSSTPS